MLTIFVGPKKEIVQTADGSLMRVYPMFVKEDRHFVHMQKRTDYSDIKEIEFFIVWRFLPFMAFEKKLTVELQKAIVDFLHLYHAKGTPFSCWSFACLYRNVHTSSELPRGWRNFWQVRTCPSMESVAISKSRHCGICVAISKPIKSSMLYRVHSVPHHGALF